MIEELIADLIDLVFAIGVAVAIVAVGVKVILGETWILNLIA